MSVSSGLFPRDEYFMRLALREAERALDHDDVPIGAVIVHEGELIESGTLGGGRPSALSLAAAGMRVADRTGALGALRLAERYLGRRLVAP